MTYVIGIDGGGTKTIGVIADMDGSVFAKALVGPTNPNVITEPELINTFGNLLKELNQQAPVAFNHITTLFAGISGAGNDEIKSKIKSILMQSLPNKVTVQVESDAINALYSGTYGAPGIVHISGTGSITYGINKENKHDRVGGWGYLFGDEGSGYDIGRRGIIAALRYYDGRGAETILLDRMFDYFNVTNASDLIRSIYAKNAPKIAISPLSKVVIQAYKKNDTVAKKIIADVAEETRHSIISLSKKHFTLNEQINVVLSGGVFNEKEMLSQLIMNELQQYDNMTIILPQMPPVGGSVIGTYLMHDKNPKQHVIDNLINCLIK